MFLFPAVKRTSGNKASSLVKCGSLYSVSRFIPSKIHWGYYVKAACYLINLLSSSILKGKSSYEDLYGSPPNIQHLCVLGFLCFASYLENRRSDNFSVRAKASVLMGYSLTQKSFSRDVIFNEKVFPFSFTKAEFFSIFPPEALCSMDEFDSAIPVVEHTNHVVGDSAGELIETISVGAESTEMTPAISEDST